MTFGPDPVVLALRDPAALPGLSLPQLESLGYSVVDADTDETSVSVPPAVPAQG